LGAHHSSNSWLADNGMKFCVAGAYASAADPHSPGYQATKTHS